MRFIATTSEKISDIEVQKGQLIFSTDDRVIYLDSDKRTSFQEIMTLINDNQRLNTSSLINGYYFVEETSILWRYNNSIWTQLTNPPSENVIFIDEKDLPETGEKKTLYVTEKVIYKWDNNTNSYVQMGGSSEWAPMV